MLAKLTTLAALSRMPVFADECPKGTCAIYCFETNKRQYVFLDTTHATPQGPGSWRFQLREPIDIRQNQICHVDDVTLKNSFPTVDTFSNRMYLLTT